MEKIDERCLKLDLYEYLTDWQGKGTRAVMVITDKQCVFYTQILPNDFKTHDDISINIENEIHPTDQRYGWDAMRDNHTYFFFDKIGIRIAMTDNGELSYTQAQFITDNLKIIDKHNKEHPEKRTKIDFHASGNYDGIYDTYDTDSIIDSVRKQITDDITIEEEKIIGSTLSEEERNENLKSQLGCKTCHNMKGIIKLLRKTERFYNNSYYKEILSTIFPDYEKLKDLAPLLEKINNNEQSIEGITLENLKSTIEAYLKKSMEKSNNYSSLLSTVSAIEKIEGDTEIFPHFKLFSKLVKELKPTDEIEEQAIEKILKSSSNYEELSEQIAYLSQKRKNQALKESKKLLQEEMKSLEKMNRQEKLAFRKSQLNRMIDEKEMTEKKIESLSKESKNQERLLTEASEKQKDTEKQIEKLSTNFFKRIIHRKKIKYHRQELVNITQQREMLRIQKERNCNRINELYGKINTLEDSFKGITDMDIPMDKSAIQELFTQSFSRTDMQNSRMKISNIESGMEKLQEEIQEIEQSGIIKKEQEKNHELQTMIQDSNQKVTPSSLKNIRPTTHSVPK